MGRLKSRLDFFEEEARWHLFALDLLASLGDLHGDASQNRDTGKILDATRQTLTRLVSFHALAFFTVDESTSDFALTICAPESESALVRKEVDALIAKGTFAWALNQNRPVIVDCQHVDRKLICHVVATKLRVRGMFIGILQDANPRLPHEHLYLLSIIIHYTANFLESAALYKLLQDHNQNLEETVRQRINDLRSGDIRFKTVLESAVDGIIVIDEKGTVSIFNPAAEKIFGCPPAEIVGKNINMLMPEPYSGEHDKYLAEYLKTGQGKIIGIGPREVPGLRKDGSVFPLDLAVNEMVLEGRRYFIGIVRDITERKRVQEELEEHRKHLSELVEKRTGEIKAMHRQLLHAEKLSAIGKLAASIAHEFNNPIYGVRNILEQVQERVPMREDHGSMVKLAIRECNRMADLVRNLQDFNRPSSGIIAPHNIHEAIDDMLMLTKKEAQRRRIVLEKRFAADMPMIDAVADEIKQVILNLIQNAMHAISEEAGGKIVVGTEVSEGLVRLKVQDNGCGISPENLDNIFEPFFTTKAAGKGTGLGLAVSYGIVKRHEGDIRVESRVGEGSTFIVTLPVKGVPR